MPPISRSIDIVDRTDRIGGRELGRIVLLLTLASAACRATDRGAASPRILRIDFDSMAAAQPPVGFIQAVTGQGIPPAWVVTNDSTAPSGNRVLLQASRDETSFHFPLCLADGFGARDVAASVRWKTSGGRMNRSGGLVLRVQDVDHYYCVRFNSLEDNIVLYCYEKPGTRRAIAGAFHLYLTEEEWHTLRVEARGKHFTVWYDGVLQFEAEDDGILAAGGAGLWSKSDSLTLFDDFEVERLDD